MGAVKVTFDEGKLKFGVDTNRDGENSIEGNVNLNEAVQEAFKRGEAVEGVGVVQYKISPAGIEFKFDTDKDGEALGELKASFMEAADEIQERFLKKD